jgi:hypothetical protein
MTTEKNTKKTTKIEKLYEVVRASSLFEKSNNEVLQSMRIQYISLPILLVWIGRFVVHDYYKNTEYFGGRESDGNYIFWFKLEKDALACEIFLDNLKESGVPRHLMP